MSTHTRFRSAAAAGLFVLALSACGSDDKSASPVSTAAGATGATSDKINVKDFSYKPNDTTVKVGTTVTWTFSDDVDHNVDPVGTSELKKSPDLAGGKTYSFTFTKAGTNDYRCDIHNSMTGSVVVVA